MTPTTTTTPFSIPEFNEVWNELQATTMPARYLSLLRLGLELAENTLEERSMETEKLLTA